MAAIGAELMVETLHGLKSGTIHPKPQDNSQATLAPLLKKEDGRIDFHQPAPEIVNRIRGFQPWPGAFTSFRGKNLHIWAARPDGRHLKEGELAVEGERLIVGCGLGTALELLELQPEGKKRMAARDFMHGYHLSGGERLGE
jgi:methionyl-tRNA formyltransferase